MAHRTIVSIAASLTTLALALGPIACAGPFDDELTQGSESALEGDGCAPGDVSCDKGGDPSVPAIDPCAPTEAKVEDPSCGTLFGWAWDGASCVELSGCTCYGACANLFKTPDACKLAHESCSTSASAGGGGDVCGQL